jgi:hypothetical protein
LTARKNFWLTEGTEVAEEVTEMRRILNDQDHNLIRIAVLVEHGGSECTEEIFGSQKARKPQKKITEEVTERPEGCGGM